MTTHSLRSVPLIVTGILSGVVQVAAGIIMYVSGVYFRPGSALVNLLLLLICIVAGVRGHARNPPNGGSTYLTSLLAGVTITVCTALVYAIYNVVSVTFFYPGFLDEMAMAFPNRERPTLGLVVANNLRGFCLWGTILSALIALAFRMLRGAQPDRRLAEGAPGR